MSSAGNVSAFLLVINPALLTGRAEFDEHVDGWLATYLAAFDEGARYPGQRAAECEAARTLNGIPLQPSMLKLLQKAGELVGVPFKAAALT